MSTLLELDDVTKRFGGIVAVDSLSFSVLEGSVTGLVGPNGAGKTTCFNLITGFLRPDHGEIRYRGGSLSHRNPPEIYELGIARSFQNLRLFAELSVLENVMLAVPSQSGENVLRALLPSGRRRRDERRARETARECLATVGLSGHDYVRAANLSYPEQKLLSLARLLATGAELLLLDEPASGLDQASVELMQQLIRSLLGIGKTVCLVEHNLDVIRALSDHVVFMDRGAAVAVGEPHEIFSQQNLAELYFGVDADAA